MISGPRKMNSKAMVAILALASCGVLLFGAEQTLENPAKPAAKNAGRILKLKEIVRIEDSGGEYFFIYPRIVKTASDGSLFVYDMDQLLQFDAQGRYLRNYFNKGQGPGELGNVSDFDFAPERVIVHYKQVLWATTSTKATDKGILVDVFDPEGRYVGAFWLKLDGSLLGVCGDEIFVLEKNADETLRIVGYRVIDDETPSM